jgi:hypothetical protein
VHAELAARHDQHAVLDAGDVRGPVDAAAHDQAFCDVF